MPFFFLFKQEQEVSGRGLTTTTKPHVHDVCNPDSLYTVFYLIYHFYHVYLCNKFYQTSPIYALMSFSPKNPPLNDFKLNYNYLTGPHSVPMD